MKRKPAKVHQLADPTLTHRQLLLLLLRKTAPASDSEFGKLFAVCDNEAFAHLQEDIRVLEAQTRPGHQN